MTLILADLPDEEIKRLDRIAAEQGTSRASVLREAVAAYRAPSASKNKDWIKRYAGIWADREDIGDAVEYQRAMREDRRPYEDI